MLVSQGDWTALEFQSLIGRLQTVMMSLILRSREVFQSLIGRLQTVQATQADGRG